MSFLSTWFGIYEVFSQAFPISSYLNFDLFWTTESIINLRRYFSNFVLNADFTHNKKNFLRTLFYSHHLTYSCILVHHHVIWIDYLQCSVQAIIIKCNVSATIDVTIPVKGTLNFLDNKISSSMWQNHK